MTRPSGAAIKHTIGYGDETWRRTAAAARALQRRRARGTSAPLQGRGRALAGRARDPGRPPAAPRWQRAARAAAAAAPELLASGAARDLACELAFLRSRHQYFHALRPFAALHALTATNATPATHRRPRRTPTRQFHAPSPTLLCVVPDVCARRWRVHFRRADARVRRLRLATGCSPPPSRRTSAGALLCAWMGDSVAGAAAAARRRPGGVHAADGGRRRGRAARAALVQSAAASIILSLFTAWYAEFLPTIGRGPLTASMSLGWPTGRRS